MKKELKLKKGKFIEEKGEILFQDRLGRKFDADCIDDIFLALQLREKANEKLEFYSVSDNQMRIDDPYVKED